MQSTATGGRNSSLYNCRTHMQDLQEVTHEVHYENFRSDRLSGPGYVSYYPSILLYYYPTVLLYYPLHNVPILQWSYPIHLVDTYAHYIVEYIPITLTHNAVSHSSSGATLYNIIVSHNSIASRSASVYHNATVYLYYICEPRALVTEMLCILQRSR